VTKRSAAPAATATAAAAAAAAAAAPAPQTAAGTAQQPAVAPVVRFNAKPAPPATRAESTASRLLKETNGNLPIAAGGALALLALGGTAAAVRGRRRRRQEQEWADAQSLSYEPFETAAAESEPAPEPTMAQQQPASAERSAFTWGNQAQTAAPAQPSESTGEQDDRRPGETWVERAYRGPSPNNPSVSLRHRLSRAAFFDKREREVAAGRAQPVDATAGLPEAAVEEQRELA
jgi:hypothetical protein